MIDWDLLRYILEVGRCGTLSAAARRLGVAQTTVTRRLGAAEEQMGGPLFSRLEGRFLPTAAGEAVIARAERMEEEAIAAAAAVVETAQRPSGPVRLTAVETIVTQVVIPLLPGLRDRFPEIVPQVISDATNLNLTRREADIALRLARPDAPELRIRRLAEIGFAVYGATGGAGHDTWCAYDDNLAHLPDARWQAAQPDSAQIALRGAGASALAAGALAGLGRALLPCYLGDTICGLDRLTGPVVRRELWMALQTDLARVPRIRATADYLVEAFAPLRGRLSGETPTLKPADQSESL